MQLRSVYCEITDIERYCARAPGSLSLLQLAVPDELLPVALVAGLPLLASAPALIEGKKFYTVQFDRQQGDLRISPDTSNRAGDFWAVTASVDIRKHRYAVNAFAHIARNRRFHAIVADAFGQQLFLPDCRLSTSLEIARRLRGRNGYTLTLTQRTAGFPALSPVVSGPWIMDDGTPWIMDDGTPWQTETET